MARLPTVTSSSLLVRLELIYVSSGSKLSARQPQDRAVAVAILLVSLRANCLAVCRRPGPRDRTPPLRSRWNPEAPTASQGDDQPRGLGGVGS
jgi:hypothetical protein